MPFKFMHDRSGSRRLAAAVIAVAFAVLCGAFAGTASAAVPGLQLVTATSADSSFFVKQAIASCPAGKKLIGTGGRLTGASGQAVIDDLTPNSALTETMVIATEDDDGTTATWSVTAFAICANPVPGLQLVTASLASNSVTGTGVTAACPAGKQLIGTGGELTDAAGEVVMDAITPGSTLTSVRVKGYEDDTGAAANWSVTAYAICANPLPGLQRVTATQVSQSAFSSGANAVCPPGKKVIGTGGNFSGGFGQVVMDDIAPDPTLTSLSVIGYEDDNGTAANWTTRAYAICATA